MRLGVMLAAVVGPVVIGVGAAIAAEAPEIDPATVPAGFFVAHDVADVPVSASARAVEKRLDRVKAHSSAKYAPQHALETVSPAAATPPKIAFIRTSTDPGGGERYELYVLNADGSGAWRLETARVTSPADEPYELDTGGGNPGPVWSPDGRMIAFVGMGDDGNVDVYVVGADGLGRQRLTHHPGVDGSPAWSPDGRTIAFTRRAREWGVGKTHIYVMNADGSGQRRLAEGYVHFSVAWSPDGRKMLFEQPNPRHPSGGPVPGDVSADLHIMNPDGSGQRNLTRDPASDKSPDWSPDGHRIAFDRGSDIWVMNPDGSGQRNLTPGAHVKSPSAAWSPDGRKIALTRRARVVAAGKLHIFVLNADGSEGRTLAQRGGSPAWSPDGRKIAFDGGQRFRLARTPPHGIFVMNADGSERRRLTQSGGNPAWSPDGKMIAFDRSVASGARWELVVMTADGSRKRALIRGDFWFSFAWSPLPKRQ
jgi:TolB protein